MFVKYFSLVMKRRLLVGSRTLASRETCSDERLITQDIKLTAQTNRWAYYQRLPPESQKVMRMVRTYLTLRGNHATYNLRVVYLM